VTGEPKLRRRRHRVLTLPSGWLLVVCLFLPGLKFCDGSLPPMVLPFAWPPAALAVLVVCAATSPAVKSYAGTLCWFVRLNVIAWCGLLAVEALDGGTLPYWLPVMLATGAFLWLVTIGERTEQAVARIATFSSAVVAVLIGLILPSPDVLWGFALAFGCACGLTVGSIWWWIEAYADSR